MRKLLRFLLLVVVLAIVGGLVFYERPLWVTLQVTHARMLYHRVQSNYVETAEGRVHYYEAEPRIPGGGVPLVLVHGLADRSESWVELLPRLRKAGFHVYAPDLLGYGRSPRPDDSDYSIATQEKFVEDFIQALGLQKTDVAGWSMGGWVTLKLALDHPDVVDRVVVYDAAGITFKKDFSDTLFHLNTPEDVNALLARLEPHAKPLPLFVARDAVRVHHDDQMVVDRGMTSMLTRKDLLDKDLPKLQQPLLIVWGGDDALTPLAIGQDMHRMVPTSELDIVEGCGHLAPVRCPARVAKATADFLKDDPAPQGSVRTLSR